MYHLLVLRFCNTRIMAEGLAIARENHIFSRNELLRCAEDIEVGNTFSSCSLTGGKQQHAARLGITITKYRELMEAAKEANATARRSIRVPMLTPVVLRLVWRLRWSSVIQKGFAILPLRGARGRGGVGSHGGDVDCPRYQRE